MSKQIRFLSNNKFKIKEVTSILEEYDIEVLPLSAKIEELQTNDVTHLVKDKALKAYKKIGRPLIVEHTGLYLENINNLPGGLTQIVWDSLLAEKFANIFGSNNHSSKAKAVTVVCYVDGKRFHFYKGEITGYIIDSPRGNKDFQWDCVFIPEGKDVTFAEMGEAEKNSMSMRKKALIDFANDFNKNSYE